MSEIYVDKIGDLGKLEEDVMRCKGTFLPEELKQAILNRSNWNQAERKVWFLDRIRYKIIGRKYFVFKSMTWRFILFRFRKG